MTQTPYYETMYILRPDIPEEEVESHLNKYRDILVELREVLDNQMRASVAWLMRSTRTRKASTCS